jgi:large subunit ribosomal protein L6
MAQPAQAATEQAATAAKQSRMGRRLLAIPKGVTVTIDATSVQVQGPKGKLTRHIPTGVTIKREGDGLRIDASSAGRGGARLQGLVRAMLATLIKGAVDGYERILELVGTGYRAEVKGKTIHFNLGFSHPKTFALPAEISANIPADSKGTQLILTSPDKASLGQAAATIRSFRPPEPYGGKGIRYRGENIRRKAGKAGKAKGGK